MDFIETTALRQRRNGGREVTVTSRLHRQKDKERQRKTEEKGDRRPAVALGAGVRWRGSSTGAPGTGLRITVAKDLRDQGSRLSTGQAEGGPGRGASGSAGSRRPSCGGKIKINKNILSQKTPKTVLVAHGTTESANEASARRAPHLRRRGCMHVSSYARTV